MRRSQVGIRHRVDQPLFGLLGWLLGRLACLAAENSDISINGNRNGIFLQKWKVRMEFNLKWN